MLTVILKILLALPIAGLMTNEDSYEVAEKLENLQKTAADFGCKLDSPFMTMSFMALLVIPAIKISDKGLFDCINFEFIDVIKIRGIPFFFINSFFISWIAFCSSFDPTLLITLFLLP